MKTNILIALGCAFWLLPLTGLVTLTLIHGTPENGYGFHYEGRGFSYDLLVLFTIPLVMLALTILLGWLAKRGGLTATAIATSSVLAVFASFSWCGWLLHIQTA
jgi:hypothetical protein